MVLVRADRGRRHHHGLLDPHHRGDGRRPRVRPARRTLHRHRPAARADLALRSLARARRRLPARNGRDVPRSPVGPPCSGREPPRSSRPPTTRRRSSSPTPTSIRSSSPSSPGRRHSPSLTTAKSSALVGVLISVTTIPAAAYVGVAAAYGNWDDCRGALVQLLLNLAALDHRRSGPRPEPSGSSTHAGEAGTSTLSHTARPSSSPAAAALPQQAASVPLTMPHRRACHTRR